MAHLLAALGFHFIFFLTTCVPILVNPFESVGRKAAQFALSLFIPFIGPLFVWVVILPGGTGEPRVVSFDFSDPAVDHEPVIASHF